MEAQSMVTQEGQPTSSLTPPTKMTFSIQKAEMDMNGDGHEPLRNTGVNAVSQENEICGKTLFCQTAEPKRCSSLNQNTGNIYVLPPGQVCASQDNNVNVGFIPDLPKPAKEHLNETGISETERAFESQDRRKVQSKSEQGLNGCYQFRCPSPEDNHNPLASDIQIVNSHDVTASKDVTTSKFHCTSSCPSLVPLPESSTTSVKPLPVPSPTSGRAERPRIIKHKPSSITFADYDCTSGLNQGAHESSDCGESSSEEDDDDDDVFTEMTQIREFLPGCRHRRAVRKKGIGGGGRECNGDGDEELDSADRFSTSTGYEAEEENSSREESPLVLLSPWSESMNQLMKRLDQLNMDIEEALSASSSPSDTPCTTRRQPFNDKAFHQSTTAWGREGNQTLNNNRIARGPSWKECHGQHIFLPNSPSVTRARPRKTEMSTKRKHGGAVGNTA